MKHVSGAYRDEMKGPNQIHKQTWSRFFALTIAAFAIAIGATACGNKDEGGGGGPVGIAYPPGVSGSCVGCPTSTTLVSSALGKSWDYNNVEQAQLSLNFYGDAAAVTAAQNSGSLYYSGQIIVGGVLRVRVAKAAPGCNIPAGDYTVSTLTPGQWQGQIFSTIQLQAVGPTTLQLTMNRNSIFAVSPAAVDWAGATFPYRIVSQVYVTSILGGFCNAGGYPEYQFGF